MAKVRSFVAVELGPHVVESLSRVQEELRDAGAKVKWVAKRNLHLTLKFLGDVEYEKVSEISRVITDAVADTRPFALRVHGIGTFPKGRKTPRVVWAGVEGDIETLEKIYARLNEELVGFGVPYEKRRFSPHATIGRVRSSAGTQRLVEAIRSHEDTPFGETEVSGLVFFMSELTSTGPIYTALAHIPFGGA
jgi:2'-5' RNA ligase